MLLIVDIDDPQHRLLIKALEGQRVKILTKNKKKYMITGRDHEADFAIELIRNRMAQLYQGIPEFI